MANLVFDFLHHYQTGEMRASDPADAYQYDEGHVMEAVVPVAVTSCEIHYWVRGMDEAEAYVPTSITPNQDGSYTILGNIPNSYFETYGDLRVYIVVTDGTASITTYEGRIHISGGYGTMGCGLPFAIGSCIAKGKQPVYCIAGDGGFQMNIQELETVRRESLPVKIFILNNKVLGKISETQHFRHGDRFAATALSGGYTVPDFTKIAEAYGIRAVSLKSYEELNQYSDWINNPEPCVFNIDLPEASLLTPKISFETGMINPKLDDSVFEKAKAILKR